MQATRTCEPTDCITRLHVAECEITIRKGRHPPRPSSRSSIIGAARWEPAERAVLRERPRPVHFQQPFSRTSVGVHVRRRSRALGANYRMSRRIRTQGGRLLDPAGPMSTSLRRSVTSVPVWAPESQALQGRPPAARSRRLFIKCSTNTPRRPTTTPQAARCTWQRGSSSGLSSSRRVTTRSFHQERIEAVGDPSNFRDGADVVVREPHMALRLRGLILWELPR